MADMKIDVLVFDGFDELDALGPYEVLSNAVAFGADADVALVATSGPGPVTGAHALTVLAQSAPRQADITIVPGGGWNFGDTGARVEVAKGDIPALLRERYDAGRLVAGVCTGAMVLAAAGVLEGRPAVTHAAAIEQLPEYGATIERRRVVDDGDVVTCGGVTSGLDLALHLAERFFGADIAAQVATEMEHDRRDRPIDAASA